MKRNWTHIPFLGSWWVLTLLAWTTPAQASTICEVFEDKLSNARAQIEQNRVQSANDFLLQAGEDLKCDGPLSVETIGEYFVLQAMGRLGGPDPSASERRDGMNWLRAARRPGPSPPPAP